MQTYTGICHCGAGRFEADINLRAGTYECDCSICKMNRFWPAVIEADAFRLLSGEAELTEYVTAPIHYADGRHDDWQSPPAAIRQL